MILSMPARSRHHTGDFRVGKNNTSTTFGTHGLVVLHAKNIRQFRNTLGDISIQGKTRKFSHKGHTGLLTEIRCGVANKVVTVKTFSDGTSQTLEENNG